MSTRPTRLPLTSCSTARTWRVRLLGVGSSEGDPVVSAVATVAPTPADAGVTAVPGPVSANPVPAAATPATATTPSPSEPARVALVPLLMRMSTSGRQTGTPVPSDHRGIRGDRPR
jgi:hypothetical protein